MHIINISQASTVYICTSYLHLATVVYLCNLNHYFTQDILIKERLSYNDQLDEESIPLAKTDQLIEKLRKENEVHNCICVQLKPGPNLFMCVLSYIVETIVIKGSVQRYTVNLLCILLFRHGHRMHRTHYVLENHILKHEIYEFGYITFKTIDRQVS